MRPDRPGTWTNSEKKTGSEKKTKSDKKK
jgi:hypothetical protein